MEFAITNYILSMGLTTSLALLVAFRAGRMDNLTQANWQELIGELSFDTLKAEITGQLQQCLNLHNGMPIGQDWQCPGLLTVRDVAVYLHGNVDNITVLQNIYLDLLNHGVGSIHFQQVLEFFASGGGGVF